MIFYLIKLSKAEDPNVSQLFGHNCVYKNSLVVVKREREREGGRERVLYNYRLQDRRSSCDMSGSNVTAAHHAHGFPFNNYHHSNPFEP